MYDSRAAAKVADAQAKKDANEAMNEVLTARLAANEAQELERQAAAFKAHKQHIIHIKEHYANLEAVAAQNLADEHAAWKAKYGAQKRLPLDTPGETWTANIPEHVLNSSDFWIKAPKP
jgi:cytochrome c553